MPVAGANLWLLIELLRGAGRGNSYAHLGQALFYTVAFVTVVPLVLAPVVVGCGAFAAERRRGTFEALLLLPADRREVLAGYLGRALRPWLLLLVCSAPLHLAICWSSVTHEPEASLLLAAMSKPVFIVGLLVNGERCSMNVSRGLIGALLTPLSLAADLSLLLFGVMVGLRASLRRCRAAAAARWAFLRGALPMATVLSLESWLLVPLFGRMGPQIGTGVLITATVVATALMLVLRIVAIRAHFRELALNFDRYALEET
jgi:hypothetical protein